MPKKSKVCWEYKGGEGGEGGDMEDKTEENNL